MPWIGRHTFNKRLDCNYSYLKCSSAFQCSVCQAAMAGGLSLRHVAIDGTILLAAMVLRSCMIVLKCCPLFPKLSAHMLDCRFQVRHDSLR